MMKLMDMLFPLVFSMIIVGSLAAGPVYWANVIPNGQSGNPDVREFQTLTNIPGTSLNVLYGGLTFNGTYMDLNDTWLLDTSSGLPVWKLASPTSAPPSRAYALAGATKSEVILFGGNNEKSPRVFFNDVWRYNLSSNTWKQDVYVVPSVLLARSYHSGALVGDTLYVFGGFVQALQQTTNDVWSYNITSKMWALLSVNGRAGAPRPREGHSAVVLNDTVSGPSIIFFGGYNGTGGMSDTWQFVIRNASWVQLTKDGDPMGPSPRWGQSAIFVPSPSRILIFGGSYVGGKVNPYYNDLWALTRVNTSGGMWWNWSMLLPDGDAEGPWRRGGHSSVLSGGNAYTFGGYGLFVGLYNDLWQLFNF